jgi:protein-disulfide isomerase
MPEKSIPILEPLAEQVDHVRGPSAGRLILEYGDYQCTSSRQAFRKIEIVEAASAAAEAASLQGKFWDMHSSLFHNQRALGHDDLRRYAAQLELDVGRFDADRVGADVLKRIRRDVDSGLASGEVRGTPTLFVDGIVHRGGYDVPILLEALRDAT